MSAFARARQAADALRARAGVDAYDVAIVLGSGWREGAAALGEATSVVPTTDLPGFVAPTVPGHEGQVATLVVAGRVVGLLSGRVHLYEGHDPDTVVHPVRTLIAAGATRVILTNACGSLDPRLGPGTVAMISDHLNLTGASPLTGPEPPAPLGSRFVDLSDLYSARVRAAVATAVPGMASGVYAGLRGPNYETPAEIAMLARAGAQLVGMSTVLEAIAARHLGAEVLGLSLVTNLAAGVAGAVLDHAEVLARGRAAAGALGDLLATVVPVV